MRFLVDECTGPTVSTWLRSNGHEVFSVFDEARGMDDDKIIQKAREENWILITNDKDFGDLEDAYSASKGSWKLPATTPGRRLGGLEARRLGGKIKKSLRAGGTTCPGRFLFDFSS